MARSSKAKRSPNRVTARRHRGETTPTGQLQTEFELAAGEAEPNPPATPAVWAKVAPPVPSEVYDSYWRFAAERQEVFFRRIAGEPAPWTENPILQQYKFTNAYRASDRVSQFLIGRVIYSGDPDPGEVFFRTLLFKLFNRVETWELLERELGAVRWADYDYARYDGLLGRARQANEKIYSAAYIMPSARSFGHPSKHQNHLKLLERMMHDHVPYRVQEARSMSEVFELLRSYPSLGGFLAFQFTIDLNYSELTNFSEMDFVVPGPGARDGIRKCFRSLGGMSEVDVIRLTAERQEQECQRLGLRFRSLWGRPLQLIDCQNLFCEVDKYARVAHPEAAGLTGRTRIKQKFQPKRKRFDYWYPPKWKLNDRISH
jgi:hypothetical protein